MTELVLALQDPVVVPPAIAASYTAGEVLLFFGAASGIIAAIGAVLVNVIVALRTGSKIDEGAKKTDGLIVAVEKVHEVTNAGLSAVKAEVASVRAELATVIAVNVELRDIIADLKAERGHKAISEARELPVAPAVPIVPAVLIPDRRVADAAAEQLKAIERNTKETVEVLKDQSHP